MSHHLLFCDCFQAMLRALANDVGKTMVEAKQYGQVVIVTNAENGWVQKMFLNFQKHFF